MAKKSGSKPRASKPQASSQLGTPQAIEQGKYRIKNQSVDQLFPTPFWVVDLLEEDANVINSQMMTELERMRDSGTQDVPAWASLQTDPVLHKRKAFKPLAKIATDMALSALEYMGAEHRGVEITGFWGNINPKDSQNFWHMHPNNILSAVYYIKADQQTGVIQVFDPRPAAAMILPRSRPGSFRLANQIDVPVQTGRLIMFPSYLPHAVPPNPSDETRVSIAINFTLKDWSEIAKPLWSKGTIHIVD